MNSLIKQYQKELKRTQKLRDVAPDHEKSIYGGMIADLDFAIKWMKSGRMPGTTKGIYGKYISNAVQIDVEAYEYLMIFNVDGTLPADCFEEAEKRIDERWEALKHG